MEAMKLGVADYSVEDFYYLSRSALVKDERNLDKFDRVFGHCFKGLETPVEEGIAIPEEWLRKLGERHLTEEEKRQIEALGGWDRLMETLRQRLEEQKKRHQGGSKWIGTAGTPPLRAHVEHPPAVGSGHGGETNKSAVKVGDKRQFENLDDQVEICT